MNNECRISFFNNSKVKLQKEFKLFKKMIDKQKELNDLTFPEWKKRLTLIDWRTAILVETGELLESYGYKWWKKQKKDLENVKVELIDILHFLLSTTFYYPKNIEVIAFNNFYNKGLKSEKHDIKNDYSFKKELLNLVSNTIDEYEKFFILGKLFKYLGINFENVYKDYFIKNILNEFRQKHGYKTGSYKKIWQVNLEGENKAYEDNEIAYYLSNKIPLEKLDSELEKRLEEIYKQIP